MRVLVIGEREFVQALADFIGNETGPDGQRYVTTRAESILPWQQANPATTSLHEIVIIHWTEKNDVTLLDALVATAPIVILLVAVPDVSMCVRAIRRGAWDYIEMAPQSGDSVESILTSMSDGVDMLGIGRGPADLEWIRDNFSTLSSDHAGEWIAVRNREVVASEPLFARLYRRPDTKNAVFWKMPEAVT